MALIDDLKTKLKLAREQRDTGVAVLLNTLITEATTVPTSEFNAGVKALKAQAAKEGWELGRLEVLRAEIDKNFKERLKAQLERASKISDELGEDDQARLDRVAAVNDAVADTKEEVVTSACEQAADEGWPLGRLEAETIALGKRLQEKVPTDDELFVVIRKFINGALESIAGLSKRQFTAQIGVKLAALKAEVDYLTPFLPAAPVALTEEALAAEIAAFKDEFKKANAGVAANVGQIMGHLKTHFAGRYDGKTASMLASKKDQTQ